MAMERIARDPRRGAGGSGRHVDATLRRERHAAMTDRTELVATVLLAFAAVATAWSGYQATRWNGEQTKASSRTNAIRIDAARAQGLSEAQKEVDVATFIQWIDAYAHRETELTTFYERRFRAGVQAGVRRVARDEAADEPERAADAVRHAAVQARRRGRRPSGSTPRPRCRRRRSGATSSVRRTTSSASSSSRSRSSSRA